MTRDYESDLSGVAWNILETRPGAPYSEVKPKRRFWDRPFPEIVPGASVRHKLTHQSYVVVSRWFGVVSVQCLVETVGIVAGKPTTVKSTASVRVPVALLEAE